MRLLLDADVHAPEHLGRRHLLVGGGRILWMGEDRPDVDPDLLEETVDLAGRTLAPGLVDGHAHLTGGGGEAGFASRVPETLLGAFTAGGITSVVGVLGTDDTTKDTRGLLARAYALREEGLSAWCHTGGYHVPVRTLTGSVRDDITFLGPVIGCGELAIADHRSSQPSLVEIMRIASDCHVAGLHTGKAGILHLHLGDGERGLDLVRAALAESELPPRVFNPTHVNRRHALFDEALTLAERGCTVDITAFPREEHDDGDTIPASEALVRYLEAGPPWERVTVSSDGGGCLPVYEDGEMQRWDVGRPGALLDALVDAVRAGLALQDALPAFTANPARLLRLHAKGRIAAGMDADLICLDEDLGLTDVMAGGVWHRREGRQLVRGSFEGGDQ